MSPQAYIADWYVLHCCQLSSYMHAALIRRRSHVGCASILLRLCPCAQVLPSSGNRSVSLWDVPDRETLQTWLDEFLDVDCSNEVFEVPCCYVPLLGPCHWCSNSVHTYARSYSAVAPSLDLLLGLLTRYEQVHEEFAYGFSEQLLRARATDQVCKVAFNHHKLLQASS